MKKLSMLMVVVCLMTMLTFPTSVSAAQTIHYSENMSGYTGWNPTIFSYRFPNWNEAGYWNSEAYEDSKYGTGIQLGKDAVVEKTLDAPITSGQVLIRANVKVLDTASTCHLGVVLRSDELVTPQTLSNGARNSAPHSRITITTDGVKAVMNASGEGAFTNAEKDANGDFVSKTITANEWHQIDTLVDFSAEKQKLYVDGEFVVEGELADSIKNNGIKAILVSGAGLQSATENKGVVVDNLKITTMKEGFTVDELVLDKASKTITVKFNEILGSSVDLSNVSLVCDESTISATAAKTDLDTITLTYTGDLTSNKRYKVVFANEICNEFGYSLAEDIEFTTTPTGIEVYDLKITDADRVEIAAIDTSASDAKIYVTGEMFNTTGEVAAAKVIIATYNGNPKTLTYVSISDLNDIEYKKDMDIEFTIPQGTDVTAIKAFVWKDMSKLTPIALPATVLFN